MILFVHVFIWLVAFFALAIIWRTVLLIATLIVLVPLVGLRGVGESNAAPESAAVHALHEINSTLQRPNGEKPEMYPDILPMVALSPLARKFCRFEYVPRRSADGMIHSYFIEAIPAHQGCGLQRSFTITSDNKVFWTLEPRAATTSDTLLAE